MNVSIAKIAEICGVSRGTVSLVLNGHAAKYRISERTAQRVLQVAKDTGYCRNQLAEAVRNGMSRTIAFVSCRLGEQAYIGQILDGIFSVLTQECFSLKVFRLCSDSHGQILKSLKEQRVEGVILHGAQQDELVMFQQELLRHGFPQATVGITNTVTGYGVCSDDASGVAEMVKYLFAQGYRRFIFCTRVHSDMFDYSRNRYRGFQEGISSLETDMIESVFAVPDDFLKINFNLSGTAIICIGDDIAVSLYTRGLREGWDMSKLAISGFGNDPFLRWAGISLTTVQQPYQKLGGLAAGHLIDWIRNGKPGMFEKAENFLLPVEVIKRDSTPCVK